MCGTPEEGTTFFDRKPFIVTLNFLFDKYASASRKEWNRLHPKLTIFELINL